MSDTQEPVPANYDDGDEWVDKFDAPGGSPPPVFVFNASVIFPYKDVTLYVTRRHSIVATAKLTVSHLTGLPDTDVKIPEKGEYGIYVYAENDQLRLDLFSAYSSN